MSPDHAIVLAESKQRLRASVQPADRAGLYPLWCVDLGEDQEESRYVGPFESIREALEAKDNWVAMFGDQCEIRRCRRQLVGELDDFRWDVVVELVRERLDDDAMNGSMDAWGDLDEPMVSVRDDGEAVRALAAWADKHLVTNVYVCEGDEATDRLALDLPEPESEPDYDALLTVHREVVEQLSLIEQDSVLGQSEVDALLAELEDLRADRQAALNACESWKQSYQDACEELAAIWKRGMDGSPKALAEAGWHLALFFQAGLREGKGGEIHLRSIIETIQAGAYALSRAEALRDQSRAKADRFRAERDEAERQRDAVARKLAEALARIEELEAECGR